MSLATTPQEEFAIANASLSAPVQAVDLHRQQKQSVQRPRKEAKGNER